MTDLLKRLQDAVDLKTHAYPVNAHSLQNPLDVDGRNAG